MKTKLVLIACLFALISFNACKQKQQPAAGEKVNANKTLTLSVGGMECTGCENTITEAVSPLEGVKKVTATFKDSTVVVEIDSTVVSLDKIKEAIENEGYTLH